MENIFVSKHPLVAHHLTVLRDKDTCCADFRASLKYISYALALDVLSDAPTKSVTVETPMEDTQGKALDDFRPVICPILRAGLGMTEGLEFFAPMADTAHVGVYRDHDTHEPQEYLGKFPPLEGRDIYLVDPMLATGGSAIFATQKLIENGADVSRISFMVLVAAPEGVDAYHAVFPGIKIYMAALDSHLNETAYIVPGLGDAGDRIFGTL